MTSLCYTFNKQGVGLEGVSLAGSIDLGLIWAGRNSSPYRVHAPDTGGLCLVSVLTLPGVTKLGNLSHYNFEAQV